MIKVMDLELGRLSFWPVVFNCGEGRKRADQRGDGGPDLLAQKMEDRQGERDLRDLERARPGILPRSPWKGM